MKPKTNSITFDWKWIFCRSFTVVFSEAKHLFSLTSLFLEVSVWPPSDESVSVSEWKYNLVQLSTGLPCLVLFSLSFYSYLSLVLIFSSGLCSALSESSASSSLAFSSLLSSFSSLIPLVLSFCLPYTDVEVIYVCASFLSPVTFITFFFLLIGMFSKIGIYLESVALFPSGLV